MSSSLSESNAATFNIVMSVSYISTALQLYTNTCSTHVLITVFFQSAGAVARVDNLEFLTDVVPKTVSYKEFKAKKAKEDNKKSTGQTTLLNTSNPSNGLNGAAHKAPAAAGATATQVALVEAMDVDDDEMVNGDDHVASPAS